MVHRETCSVLSPSSVFEIQNMYTHHTVHFCFQCCKLHRSVSLQVSNFLVFAVSINAVRFSVPTITQTKLTFPTKHGYQLFLGKVT